MKFDINNPEHAAMIARYLSGEMEEAERGLFEGYIREDAENIALITQLKDQWELAGSLGETVQPDPQKAWDKLYSRLSSEQLIPQQKRSGNRSSLYLRVAALIIILIGVGTLIIWTNSDHQKTEMISLTTRHATNTLVKVLNDGSIVYIAQNSNFSFPEVFAVDHRNVELKGEAFFDIRPDAAKPFVIETEEAKIEVLGTAFNVKAEKKGAFVLCVNRGKVKVTLKNQPSISATVVAGQKVATIDHHLVTSDCEIENAGAWYTRKMHFRDEPLENIIKVLNRNFNTTFALTGSEIGQRRLTVTFENETVETMTELICISLNLKSQVKNDTIVLSNTKSGARDN